MTTLHWQVRFCVQSPVLPESNPRLVCPCRHTTGVWLSTKGKTKRQLVHFRPPDTAPTSYLSSGQVTLRSSQLASLSHAPPCSRGITTLLPAVLCGATARKALPKSQSWWRQARFPNRKLLFCYLYWIKINDHHKTTVCIFNSHYGFISIARPQDKVWQER